MLKGVLNVSTPLNGGHKMLYPVSRDGGGNANSFGTEIFKFSSPLPVINDRHHRSLNFIYIKERASLPCLIEFRIPPLFQKAMLMSDQAVGSVGGRRAAITMASAMALPGDIGMYDSTLMSHSVQFYSY